MGYCNGNYQKFQFNVPLFSEVCHPNKGVLKNKDEAIDKQHERDVNIPLQVGRLLKVKVQFKKERLNI